MSSISEQNRPSQSKTVIRKSEGILFYSRASIRNSMSRPNSKVPSDVATAFRGVSLQDQVKLIYAARKISGQHLASTTDSDEAGDAVDQGEQPTIAQAPENVSVLTRDHITLEIPALSQLHRPEGFSPSFRLA